MALPATLDVWDDDGILALVNVDTYRWSVEWVDIDPDLTSHFATEANAGRALVWRTSELGGGDYTVALVGEASPSASTREFTAPIEVTAGRLYLVNYTDLTMVADEPDGGDGPLPKRTGADWYVELDNGWYEATVRQLFDPDQDVQGKGGPSFEIVLEPRSGAGEQQYTSFFWWNGV